MTIAFVIDSLSNTAIRLIRDMEKHHSICIFLPETDPISFYDAYQIRKFTADVTDSVFQRYDIVLYFSEFRWNELLPLVSRIKGYAIIGKNHADYGSVSPLALECLTETEGLGERISTLTPHLHWYAREIVLIRSRLEKFGLYSKEIEQKLASLYGKPINIFD
jgi:hypothetical protein